MRIKHPKLPPAEGPQAAVLEHDCEHFLNANRVALELLGELIPKVSSDEHDEVHHRLGVIEDILEGANKRYEEG